METIYYNLDARRFSTRGMASGETSPRCRSYAVLRKVEQTHLTGPGRVLDMAAYRRKLEGTVSHQGGDEGAGGGAAEARSAAPCPPVRSGSRRLALGLDLCATLAVLIMAAVVVNSFVGLL